MASDTGASVTWDGSITGTEEKPSPKVIKIQLSGSG